MNSKESFLNALQQGSAVLAESEQQDILEEYAQHIELKMSGGLTEEEVIQDFGDIHQLIAEILEAYHVNPSYATENRKSPNMSLFIRRQLTCLSSLIQSAAHKTAHAAKRFFRAVRKRSEQVPAESPLAESQSGMSKTENVVSHPFKKIGCSFIRLLKVTAWFAWNGVLFLCAMPIIFLGILVLLLLGVIIVWLTQGMPLVGSLLCCAGILATCVGILGLGNNLVWHRHRAAVCNGSEDTAFQKVTQAGETLTEKEGFNDAEK